MEEGTTAMTRQGMELMSLWSEKFLQQGVKGDTKYVEKSKKLGKR